MTDQLETWLEVMLNGSTAAPRQRSRDPQTAQIHILGIAPIIHAWAAAGHQSLAEITPAHVRAALPASRVAPQLGRVRAAVAVHDPEGAQAHLHQPHRAAWAPPASTAPSRCPWTPRRIRDALNSPDPVVAVAVALVAFHALTVQQVAAAAADRHRRRPPAPRRAATIPLADPVRVRLAAWLDHRQRTWPGCINPHLIVSRLSAPRLIPVSEALPLAQDRPVRAGAARGPHPAEIHATGGDVRRICDLFGLSIGAALRYDTTAALPGPAVAAQQVRRT